jgi:hypothetical protein
VEGWVSKKQHQTKHHDRSKHDAAVKHHNEEVYSSAQPKWVRYVLIGVVAVVVVSLTLLFVGGLIKW